MRGVEKDISIGKKKLWDYTKSKKKNTQRSRYIYKDKTLNSAKSIADAFGEHFQSVYSTEPSLYTCNFYSEYLSDEIDTFTLTEKNVQDSLSKLPSNKGPGADGIPPSILKLLSNYVSRPLLHIFNISLKCKVFPDLLKHTLVTPVPKKSGTYHIDNHRPIAQLSSIAKVFEICIFDEMSKLVYNKISPQQHGFITRRSTVTNLVEFYNSVSKNLNTLNKSTLFTRI